MATHKVDLSFWEYAAVLERRVSDQRDRFRRIAGEFSSYPNRERLDEMIAQAEVLLNVETERRGHAGTSRCEPLPKPSTEDPDA